MRRRALLTGAAAMAGAGLFIPDRAGAGWGTLDPRTNPWGPNASNRPILRILEIFLYGGLSPWETFYLNPATGGAAAACPGGSTCPASPDPSEIMQWGTYKCQFEALARADTRRPAGTEMTKELVPGVHLGPSTYPLWRPDLFDHLQVLVSAHDLLPHEAAIPYALTGTRLGRPTLAGTGAFAARYFEANQLPVSFVVKAGGGTVTDNFAAATATGDLGSAFKPMLIEVPCGGPDLSVLTRQATPAQDLLLKYYVDDYRARLTFPGKTEATRSAAFSGYDATLGQFLNTQQIQTLIGGYSPSDNALITGEEPDCVRGMRGSRCSGAAETDGVRQSLNFAAFLLKQASTRYVCVIDTGRQDEMGAGYDTHANNAQVTYRNLSSTLEVIARLTDPSQPGGSKIDPFTMIVINTEFGRTPNKQGSNGRAHYPYAYANLIIPPSATGPAFPFRPPRRVLGGIDEGGRVVARSGSSIAAITPTDLRAAMLMALGIDPLAKPDGSSLGSAFGVGDMSEGMQAATENGVRANLVREVLGYDV
jgi:hypothetical protein